MLDAPATEIVWEAPAPQNWTDSKIDEFAYRIQLEQELIFQQNLSQFLDENELNPYLTAKVCMRFALFYFYATQTPLECVIAYQIKPEWKNIEAVNQKYN